MKKTPLIETSWSLLWRKMDLFGDLPEPSIVFNVFSYFIHFHEKNIKCNIFINYLTILYEINFGIELFIRSDTIFTKLHYQLFRHRKQKQQWVIFKEQSVRW